MNTKEIEATREPDGQIPVDENHAELADQPEPDEIVGEPQYGIEPEKGSDDERTTKVRSKATLGRHTTGEDGPTVTKRRKKAVSDNKKATEKVFADHRQAHHPAK